MADGAIIHASGLFLSFSSAAADADQVSSETTDADVTMAAAVQEADVDSDAITHASGLSLFFSSAATNQQQAVHWPCANAPQF